MLRLGTELESGHIPFLLQLAQLVLCDQRDVFLAFSQGRQVDPDDVESVEEILAETPLLRHGRQITVRRGDDPRIGMHGLRRTDRVEGAVLQHAEKFHLELRAHFADFIEKDRTLVGELEATGARRERSGEGSLYMTKEFTLEQLFGDGAAVHGHQTLGMAPGEVMQGTRNEFFAGTTLARHQDGGLGGADLANQRKDALHRRVGSDDSLVARNRIRG